MQRRHEDRKVLLDLAAKLGATVHFTVPVDNNGGYDGPRASSETRTIWAIDPDKSEEAFWSTLHELGHIAKGHVGKSSLQRMLGITDPNEPEQEAEAWTWALANAGRPVDDVAKTDITFSISSYLYTNRPQYPGDRDLNIGPNLRELFTLVGPTANADAIRKTFPGREAQQYADKGAQIWNEYASKYGAAEKLAA